MRFIASPNYSTGGNLRQVIVIHTAEWPHSAAQLGTNWLAKREAQVSYHYGIDASEVVQYVREVDRAWHARENGNVRGIGVSFMGYAARSEAEWLAWPGFDRGARLVADIAARNGIPVRRIGANHGGYHGRWGICGHADVPGNPDRSDPGAGFPWAKFLDRVRTYQKSTEPEDATVKHERSEAERLGALILDQLAGPGGEKFAGWPQLNGRTIVNALAEIGHHLGIPGYEPPARKDSTG